VAAQLTFEIGKVGSITPKVKKPSALQRQLQLIANGGLRILKDANISVGEADRSATPDPGDRDAPPRRLR
jgi:hypothetical protein